MEHQRSQMQVDRKLHATTLPGRQAVARWRQFSTCQGQRVPTVELFGGALTGVEVDGSGEKSVVSLEIPLSEFDIFIQIKIALIIFLFGFLVYLNRKKQLV